MAVDHLQDWMPIRGDMRDIGITCCIAIGAQQGKKVFTLQSLLPSDTDDA